jgi:hypothetical protein
MAISTIHSLSQLDTCDRRRPVFRLLLTFAITRLRIIILSFTFFRVASAALLLPFLLRELFLREFDYL